jgi:hypothetical protein
MLEPARIPRAKVRNTIFALGAICCVFYIVFLLIMKAMGLIEVTGLRAVNYVVLFFVCFFGIKRWINQTEHFIPFLTVFVTAFLTGVFSFLLFSIFLLFYTKFDHSMTELFNKNAPMSLQSIPSVIILFEGSAISIITAFINMQYFRRYEEGEVSATKHHTADKQH